MEGYLTKAEAKTSKKVVQRLIMEVKAKEDLAKLEPNPRHVSYLQFEDYFNKLEGNTLERKISPTLNTEDAFVS